MTALRSFRLALALVFIGAPAMADTLEDAVHAAYGDNPNLEDARLALSASRENRVQARAGYLPSVTLNTTYGVRQVETEQPSLFGISRTDERLNPGTANVRLSQGLYAGGRRDAQGRLAEAGIAAAQANLEATEQDVLLAVVDAYMGVRTADAIVAIRSRNVEGLERQLHGATRRLQVGEVTRTDVAQAEGRLASARAQFAAAEAERARAIGDYQAVVGIPPNDLAPPPPPPPLPQSFDTALAEAYRLHPLLEQARQNERAAAARIGIERAGSRPRVDVVVDVDHFEQTESADYRRDSSSALLQLSVPLYEGGFTSSRTRQARINLERAAAQTSAQRRDVARSVAGAWNDARAAAVILEMARQQVDATRTALNGVEREHGLGLRTTLDVLDAERDVAEAEIGLIRAESDVFVVSHMLLAAMGVLKRDRFTQGAGATEPVPAP